MSFRGNRKTALADTLCKGYRQRYDGLRLGEIGAFKVQKVNRSTEPEPITKLSYEALNAPLPQAAVTSFLGLYKHCHLPTVYRCHFINKTIPQVKRQIEFILFVKRFKLCLQVSFVNLFC